MTIEMPQFMLALPEIIVLIFACLALLCALFFKRSFNHGAYCITQLGLIIAFTISLLELGDPTQVTFSGLFISDDIARLLKLFIYLSAFVANVYARQYIEDRNMPSSEYYVLGLFSVLGMMVLVSAHSFLTVYLGLELLSLPLYAMIALRRDHLGAVEAAMKYFIMGTVASGMMLYGMSLLYGVTGSLDLSLVSQGLDQVLAQSTGQILIFSFALVFLVAGLGFKMAAAPFHMWAPDVYTGAPTAVTVFLSTAPKIAALGMTFRLLLFALPDLFDRWQELLIVLAVLSIVIGNLFAIVQVNIKRLLSYSAISHIGYMLLGLIAGTAEGYAAALFYILIYALMSLAGFGMIVLLSKAGFEAERIEDFKGLNARNPWLAFIVLLVMFSMAGIPPTVGFFSKFLVIKAIIDVNMLWLAILALLFAVVGAFYYLRIVKTMYFDEVDAKTATTAVVLPRDMQIVISINGIVILLLGVIPGGLIEACRAAFGI